MRRVAFYFDYLSPYAYLAWHGARELCESRGVALDAVPVLLAGLLNHWGQRGPAEIGPKREWVFKDAFRCAALRGLPMIGRRTHPFNPLPALRVSLADVAGDDQPRVVSALFDAGWGRGIDLGSRDDIQAALDGVGLDGAGLLAHCEEASVKAQLRSSTDAAIARGVFGVPTLAVDGELFWGSDRLDHLALRLDGRDPLDPVRVREALARPAAASRR
jgi:2-hydroxychromene-2-carboxylate isomerase